MPKNVKKQILYSIILYLLFFLFYPVIVSFVQNFLTNVLGWDIHVNSRFGGHQAAYWFVRAMLRFVLSIIAIILFGVIIQTNGFKYSFKLKGFQKGLLAISPIFLIIIICLALLFNISEFNMYFAYYIPYIILFDIATGIYEEVIYRAIPLTALLYYFGNSTKGKLILTLVTSVIFGFAHYSAGVDAILVASLMGISFSAVYIYSKNLLACMIYHTLWNIGTQITLGLTTSVYSGTLDSALHLSINIMWLIIMPIFSIILIVKSKPFSEDVNLYP